VKGSRKKEMEEGKVRGTMGGLPYTLKSSDWERGGEGER